MLFVGVETIDRYERLVKCQNKDGNWVNLAPDTDKHALIFIFM